MKILCLHRELVQPGGSETYMQAIIEELHRRHHSVYLYTLKRGKYINKLKPFCHIIEDEESIYNIKYDGVIAMHRPMKGIAIKAAGFKTMICNGIIPIELALEGYDRYISVSPEVWNANKQLGFDSDIIYNGIDLTKFDCYKPTRKKLKEVLLISNHYPGVIETVRKACKIRGLNFNQIGGPFWTTAVKTAIDKADLVVSLGRGAYEAMASERNVIIFDYRGGDGFVTPENLPVFRAKNCSGRTGQFQYTPQQLASLFDMYDRDLGPKLRAEMKKDHDIRKVVRELLRPITVT